MPHPRRKQTSIIYSLINIIIIIIIIIIITISKSLYNCKYLPKSDNEH